MTYSMDHKSKEQRRRDGRNLGFERIKSYISRMSFSELQLKDFNLSACKKKKLCGGGGGGHACEFNAFFFCGSEARIVGKKTSHLLYKHGV